MKISGITVLRATPARPAPALPPAPAPAPAPAVVDVQGTALLDAVLTTHQAWCTAWNRGAPHAECDALWAQYEAAWAAYRAYRQRGG